MAKISFDMDHTISQWQLQEFAKLLVMQGNEVWIVTSRMAKSQGNRDIYRIAENIGIPKTQIHFTEGAFKEDFLNKNKVDFHFDDNYAEYKAAKENFCKTFFISVYDPSEVIET